MTGRNAAENSATDKTADADEGVKRVARCRAKNKAAGADAWKAADAPAPGKTPESKARWRAGTEKGLEAAAAAHRIFATAAEFTAAADRYFAECDKAGKLYGEAGLCLALSAYNGKGLTVTLRTLHDWYDGESCPDLQEAVQTAYLRIQEQIETDSAYREKGMTTRAIFLQKQARFGGYQDKVEAKQETTVRVIHGDSMDDSDFA